MAIKIDYLGYAITVNSFQGVHGRWGSGYLIQISDHTVDTGYVQLSGSFSSQLTADSAALGHAKAAILENRKLGRRSVVIPPGGI